MQLLAASRAVRLGLEHDRRRVADSPRDNPVNHVLERVERLPVASNQDSGAVALDFELERIGIGLEDAHHLPLLAHQLQDSSQDLGCFGGLLIEIGAAPRRVGIFLAVAAMLASAIAIIARLPRRSGRLRLLRTRSARTFSKVGPILLPPIFSAIFTTLGPLRLG